MNKIILSCLGLCLITTAAWSDEPLVFRREEITIIPKSGSTVAAINTEQNKPESESKKTTQSETSLINPDPKDEPKTELKPSDLRKPQKLVAEFHPESFLYQPGMTIINPVENKNYLLIFTKSEKSALNTTTIYAPMDIVFISPEGTITQIAPKLSLHDLTGPVGSTQPVKAFLMLSAGEAETLDIRPGDQIQHSLFQPKTQVVKEPTPPKQ